MTVLAVSGTPTPSLRPGLTFARSSSKWYSPLTISAVSQDGLFGKSPLVPGVIVLTINGQEATWMHPNEAKSLVKSGEPISITVEAFIAKIVRKKRLEKLGIVLKEIKGEKGLLIEEIPPNSPFAETCLIPGMKIVNINGTRCPNRPKEAIKLMHKIFGMMKVVAVITNRDMAAQMNQDAAAAEVVMNWTKSVDSTDTTSSKSKLEKAIREAQVKRKVELKRKLSKQQDDKFSKGLDKLESSLIRLESSVKVGSSSTSTSDIVRSRTENSETPLIVPSNLTGISSVQSGASTATKHKVSSSSSPKKDQEEKIPLLAEGYTIRKTGSFICDIDECDSEALESEKSSSKRFHFQNSPAAAISKLKKLGKRGGALSKKNDDDDHSHDDATSATTASTKYFNFDHQKKSPSEAMAKLKKFRKNFDPQSPSEAMARRLQKLKKTTTTNNNKTPQSNNSNSNKHHRRRRKKKSKRQRKEGGDNNDSPHRPRAVDFAGQVRKVSKKARAKIRSTVSLTSSSANSNQETVLASNTTTSASAKRRHLTTNTRSGTKAETKQQQAGQPLVMPRVRSPTKPAAVVALPTIMSFGGQGEEEEKKKDTTELSKQLRVGVRVVQTREDEMGMEICIDEGSREGDHDSHSHDGHLSVQGIVMMAESSDDVVVDDSDRKERAAAETGGPKDTALFWPIQQVNSSSPYDDTTLALAGLNLADPKRATSPRRHAKEAKESGVSSEEPPNTASETVVINMDELSKKQQKTTAVPKIEDAAMDELPPKEHQTTTTVEPKIDDASIEETSSQDDSVSIPSFLTGSEAEYYYSDEFETDSEYDSFDDDDDFSGSEGEWSDDSSPETSVAENDGIPSNTIHLQYTVAGDEEIKQQLETRDSHQVSSQSNSGENESSTRDHMDSAREALHQTKLPPMEMVDSRDEDEEEYREVRVCIIKESKDDILGFRIFKHDDRDGIFVSEIDQSSELLQTGLTPGMQVIKVNGKQCPDDFAEAVSYLKNSVGAVEIEAVTGHQKKNQSSENALMVHDASLFIESKLSNIFSGVCLSGEDDTTPEFIVKNY